MYDGTVIIIIIAFVAGGLLGMLGMSILLISKINNLKRQIFTKEDLFYVTQTRDDRQFCKNLAVLIAKHFGNNNKAVDRLLLTAMRIKGEYN